MILSYSLRVLVGVAIAALPQAVSAARFQVVHAFLGGSDGQAPVAGLIANAGTLYSTTCGGYTECQGPSTPSPIPPVRRCSKSCGTLYSLVAGSAPQTIHRFADNGQTTPPNPSTPLLVGNDLYGTTLSGGATGAGTVFKIAPDGSEKLLYSFCAQPNCGDGAFPYSGVVVDRAGNFYGTTSAFGQNNAGVVFKLTPAGVETVVHPFCNQCSDGSQPEAGLAIDNAGNLFGTTELGGDQDRGTVFKIGADGSEAVLHSFCTDPAHYCADGRYPVATLVVDPTTGILFGTASAGGSAFGCAGNGCGVVFKLVPDGDQYDYSVLLTFEDGDGGSNPVGPLTLDAQRNLFGTTKEGGSGAHCPSASGCGTVFRLAPDGTETVLHAFCSQPGCADGRNPLGGLLIQGQFLFGTALNGGSTNCYNGCGTIFKVAK